MLHFNKSSGKSMYVTQWNVIYIDVYIHIALYYNKLVNQYTKFISQQIITRNANIPINNRRHRHVVTS